MALKECIDKQHIHRQPCRTGHERYHQHRQQPVLRILDIFGCHDSRHVAAETHQHRDETAAVQAYLVHDRIHDEGFTGHVSRVFHQADEEEQDDDIRQESEDGAYTLQHTVYQHTRPPARCHQPVQPLSRQFDTACYPFLRISTEREGAPEHEIEHSHHDRESQPRIGQHLVYFLQPCLLLVVLRVRERFR